MDEGEAPRAETPIPAGLDRLHMRAGRTMDVRLMGVKGDSIYYRMPEGTEVFHMTRNRVLFITRKNGEKERMQEEIREVLWQDVVELRDAKDTRMMKHLEHYDEKLTSQNIRKRVKAKELEGAAVIQLKKRAAMVRATHLLIRKVDFVTTYGEPPSLHIVGDAYRQVGTGGKPEKPGEAEGEADGGPIEE
ncbi:MAG: hypothetical protein CSA07_03425 [Bacteroidia bacterium]|nr:MAG: hypothetical protein CSA07_03425 [Bacteroidia bacterium]